MDLIVVDIESVGFQKTGERRMLWKATYGDYSIVSLQPFYAMARLLKSLPQDTLMTCRMKGSSTNSFTPKPISFWAKWSVNDELRHSKYNTYFENSVI